jgi:hypothetical protein
LNITIIKRKVFNETFKKKNNYYIVRSGKFKSFYLDSPKNSSLYPREKGNQERKSLPKLIPLASVYLRKPRAIFNLEFQQIHLTFYKPCRATI